MSYHAHTFTMVVARSRLPPDGVMVRDGQSFVGTLGVEELRGFSTYSRNNALLLWHFARIYAASRRPVIAHLTAGLVPDAWEGERYFVLADDAALQATEHGVGALLDDIRDRPSFVADALREADRTGPGQLLLAATGEPVANVDFVHVTDEDRRLDGWVYPYFDHEIPPLLDAAQAVTEGQLQSPEPDDEGETLGYLFAFLKSQLAVMTHARETAQACVFMDYR